MPHQNLKNFNDKPVVDFNAEIGIQSTENAYRLRLGFEEHENGESLHTRLEKFCQDPKVKELKELIIGYWSYDEQPNDIIQTIINNKKNLTQITHLMMGDIVSEECEISWITQTNLTPIIDALPNLEHFQVRGGMGLDFKELNHPKIQTFIVETGGLTTYTAKKILNANLPELRHLEIWMGDQYYGFDSKIEDYMPLLNQPLFPKMKHLGFCNSSLADDFAIALKDSNLLDRIETLDLSMGTFGDVGAQAILDNPNINKLKHLNLEHHYMTQEFVDKMKKLGISVNTGTMKKEGQYGRYTAVTE